MICDLSAMSITGVLNQLYDNFYKDWSGYSEVTSSHWQSVGGHAVVRSGGGWKLTGKGFGDRAESDFFSSMKKFPSSLFVSRMKVRFECDSKLWALGKMLAKKQGRIFDFDCAKQVIALDLLVKSLGDGLKLYPLVSQGVRQVCVIGDGYGYLGSLLKALDPALQITSVNLGRGLFFDAFYTGQAFPNATGQWINQAEIPITDFSFLDAESYERLAHMHHDLYINIASMQEMNLEVVNNYLAYIRAGQKGTTRFYCCNRVDKKLPDDELVCFSKYGWSENDILVFDELCPWYQEYPSGFPPRWRSFDGPIWHRLAVIAPK